MDFKLTNDLAITETGDLQLLENTDAKQLQVVRAISTPVGYISALVNDSEGTYAIDDLYGSEVYSYKSLNLDQDFLNSVTRALQESLRYVENVTFGTVILSKIDNGTELKVTYVYNNKERELSLFNLQGFEVNENEMSKVFLNTSAYWKTLAGFKITIPVNFVRQNYNEDVFLLVTGLPNNYFYYFDKTFYENNLAFLTINVPKEELNRGIDFTITSLGKDLIPTTSVIRLNVSSGIFIYSNIEVNSSLILA